MGIPRFLKWIISNCPDVFETIDKNKLYSYEGKQIEFLYLDINSLFYAALTDDDNPEKMLTTLFEELDGIIKETFNPKSLIYIAMDGVAPRAKMNTQRLRRYNNKTTTSVKASFTSSTAATRFFHVPKNSVAISPGTEFMVVANKAIRYYIYQLLNQEDYNSLQIIFNDSQVPGEGEYKIFQYLDSQTHRIHHHQTPHVVYGNDSDFILYALLRNQSDLQIILKSQDDNNKVNIDKLRNHIIVGMVGTMNAIKHRGNNNLINDFVCILNFIGNDYIPPLITSNPSLSSIKILLQAYNNYFRINKGSIGYITTAAINNNNSSINLERLYKFLECLEVVVFQNNRNSTILSSQSNVVEKVNDYINMLKWNFQYFQGNCQSWRCFYSHRKAPTIQCNELLPSPLRGLLQADDSPLKKYFPKKNGSKFNALPFIDEGILTKSIGQKRHLIGGDDWERGNCLNKNAQIFSGCKSETIIAHQLSGFVPDKIEALLEDGKFDEISNNSVAFTDYIKK
nr:2178_t:CDS:2 [Entrophospora candida]